MNDTAVQVSDLRFSFGDRAVLNGAEATVLRGEKVVIKGRNGAGKTTLLKALLGLLPSVAGRIEVLGREVGSAGWRRNRFRVGYLNQEAIRAEMPIAAREVVGIGTAGLRMGRTERSAVIRDAMDMTGCADYRNARFSSLSGGEKQRVSLARCFAQGPELLLLDEPASSLDPEARTGFLRILDRLSAERRIAVLMVTHEETHFSLPGWTYLLLDDGKLRAEA